MSTIYTIGYEGTDIEKFVRTLQVSKRVLSIILIRD